jgi:hypothetical protein
MSRINSGNAQVSQARRVYVRPVLIEKGPITTLTEASNGVAGADDGGGFPNFYS